MVDNDVRAHVGFLHLERLDEEERYIVVIVLAAEASFLLRTHEFFAAAQSFVFLTLGQVISGLRELESGRGESFNGSNVGAVNIPKNSLSR